MSFFKHNICIYERHMKNCLFEVPVSVKKIPYGCTTAYMFNKPQTMRSPSSGSPCTFLANFGCSNVSPVRYEQLS